MKFFDNKHSVTIDPWSIMFAIFFILALYGLYYIRAIVILVFLAFIIMVAVSPLVHFLQRRLKIPHGPAIGLAYLLVVVGFVLLLATVIPPLVHELQQLIENVDLPVLEDEIRRIQQDLSEISFSLNDLPQLMSTFSSVGSSVGVVFSVLSTAFNTVFTLFTLFVLSVYFMVEREHLYKKVGWFSRDRKHISAAQDFIKSLEVQLGGWVRGQLILMFVIGLITYIGFSLLSIPYALPLAILAGLLEILPNLGPTIATIPAIILGFVLYGPLMGVIVLLFSIVVQQLENNLLVPKIMSANANVNPLVAIIAILTGLKVGNVIGALIAIPVYIVMRSFYSEVIRPRL